MPSAPWVPAALPTPVGGCELDEAFDGRDVTAALMADALEHEDDARSHRASAWIGAMGCVGLDGADPGQPMLHALHARLFDLRAPLARRLVLAAAAASLSWSRTGELVERLESSSDRGRDEDREVAARALAAPRHLEAVPALKLVLLDGGASAGARAAAAHALGAIGDGSAAPALTAALEDEDAGVRREVVVALRALAPSRRSARLFLEAAGDADVEVRCAALAALLVVGGASACTAARQALTDHEGAVRALAVVVLARHGGGRDAAMIRRLGDDVDARVRRAARHALMLLAA